MSEIRGIKNYNYAGEVGTAGAVFIIANLLAV